MMATTLLGSGLGLTAGEAAVTIQKLGPHLDTIATIVTDPLFPTLMERIKTLNTLDSGVAGLGATTAQARTGLRWAVRGLDTIIFVKRNPWAVGLVGAGFLLLIGSVGYSMGKRRR